MNDFAIKKLGFNEHSEPFNNLLTAGVYDAELFTAEQIKETYSLSELRHVLGGLYSVTMRELAFEPQHLLKGKMPTAKGTTLRVKKDAVRPYAKLKAKDEVESLEQKLRDLRAAYGDLLD